MEAPYGNSFRSTLISELIILDRSSFQSVLNKFTDIGDSIRETRNHLKAHGEFVKKDANFVFVVSQKHVTLRRSKSFSDLPKMDLPEFQVVKPSTGNCDDGMIMPRKSSIVSLIRMADFLQRQAGQSTAPSHIRATYHNQPIDHHTKKQSKPLKWDEARQDEGVKKTLEAHSAQVASWEKKAKILESNLQKGKMMAQLRMDEEVDMSAKLPWWVRLRRLVIPPESRFRLCWNMFMALSFIYLNVSIAIRLARSVFEGKPSNVNLLILDFLIDGMIWVDMLFQAIFFSYYELGENGVSTAVSSRWLIWKHFYETNRLNLWLIAYFPYDIFDPLVSNLDLLRLPRLLTVFLVPHRMRDIAACFEVINLKKGVAAMPVLATLIVTAILCNWITCLLTMCFNKHDYDNFATLYINALLSVTSSFSLTVCMNTYIPNISKACTHQILLSLIGHPILRSPSSPAISHRHPCHCQLVRCLGH